MPKVKSSKSEQLQGGGSIQEGIYRVVAAVVFLIASWKSKEGKESHPFVARMKVVKLDKDLEPINEDDVLEQDLIVTWPKKDTGEYRLRPGNGKSADDDEPEDLGDEIGTEGNTIYADEGAALFADGGYAKFCASLEDLGFKSQVLDQSFGPNFEGLVFEAGLEPRKYTAGDGSEKQATDLVAKKVFVFPYEKGAAKKSGKSNAGAKAKSGSKSGAKSTDNGNLDELFATGLADVIEDVTGQTVARTDFQQKIRQALMAGKHCDMKTAMKVVGAMKQNDWLEARGEEAGFAVDGDSVTFE